MAFRPNVDCSISPPGPDDEYGRPTATAMRPAKCGVVKLVFQAVKTALRTDASATHGGARELEALVQLLFLPETGIDLDWVVDIAGRLVRVMSIEPQFNVAGRLDHYQVGCDMWQVSDAAVR